MNTKIIKITSDYLEFDNGIQLMSEHERDCCEDHYLDFDGLILDDFKDLEFDLSNDQFFTRVEGYGILLNPIKGFSVRIPGYGFNNGYYSSNLDLHIIGAGINKTYDISECQEGK